MKHLAQYSALQSVDTTLTSHGEGYGGVIPRVQGAASHMKRGWQNQRRLHGGSDDAGGRIREGRYVPSSLLRGRAAGFQYWH